MNPRPLSEDILNLVRRTAEANTALLRGDIDGYLALIEHRKDYTLMAPFGGAPTRGFDTSSRVAMARFFKSGTFDQEVVATYATGDLVVLVTIERVRAEGRRAARAGLVAACHTSLSPNGGSCIGMLIRS